MATKKKATAHKAAKTDRRKPGAPEFLYGLLYELEENKAGLMADPQGFTKMVTAFSAANGLRPVDTSLLGKIKVPTRVDLNQNMVAMSAAEVGEKCTNLLAALGHEEQNKVVAMIVKFAIATRQNRSNNADRSMLDSRNAKNAADNSLADLNNILTGNFSLI